MAGPLIRDKPPLTLSERARLRELEREVRELRMKTEFLGKAAAFSPGVSVSENSYSSMRRRPDIRLFVSERGVPL
jgi:transposase-like protein